MDLTQRLSVVRGAEATADTAQTAGMRRLAALSGATVGARALWMGRTHVAPGTSSGPHHHGRSETAVYVVAGTPVFVYRHGDQVVRLATEPGDFVYVPPHVPHVEENPSPETEAVVVIARSTQEPVVVNLRTL